MSMSPYMAAHTHWEAFSIYWRSLGMEEFRNPAHLTALHCMFLHDNLIPRSFQSVFSGASDA